METLLHQETKETKKFVSHLATRIVREMKCLDGNDGAWEISHVTTISVADKNRLTVRGVRDGARYLVKRESNGWWIEPAPQPQRRRREWAGAKRKLAEHLKALSDNGLVVDAIKSPVPPCRF